MILRDILPEGKPIKEIQVRTNSPYGGDMYFGSCTWDGENLSPLDYEIYDLDDHINGYEFEGEGDDLYLTYWIVGTWI